MGAFNPSENIATSVAINNPVMDVESNMGSKSPFLEGCIPEVEGCIDLSLIDQMGTIRVHEGLRIEDVMVSKSGEKVSIGFGPTQEIYARGIFLRVSSQAAFNQRQAKITLLKEINRFMEDHPEGGFCETRCGLKFLRPSKKAIAKNQQFEAIEF